MGGGGTWHEIQRRSIPNRPSHNPSAPLTLAAAAPPSTTKLLPMPMRRTPSSTRPCVLPRPMMGSIEPPAPQAAAAGSPSVRAVWMVRIESGQEELGNAMFCMMCNSGGALAESSNNFQSGGGGWWGCVQLGQSKPGVCVSTLSRIIWFARSWRRGLLDPRLRAPRHPATRIETRGALWEGNPWFCAPGTFSRPMPGPLFFLLEGPSTLWPIPGGLRWHRLIDPRIVTAARGGPGSIHPSQASLAMDALKGSQGIG